MWNRKLGVIIAYVLMIISITILQTIFSDNGFIFKDYNGRKLINFIFTLLFVILCFSFGFFARKIRSKAFIYTASFIWGITFLVLFGAENNLIPESYKSILFISVFVFYPPMCGISYVGFVESYGSMYEFEKTIIFGILGPLSITYIGYFFSRTLKFSKSFIRVRRP